MPATLTVGPHGHDGAVPWQPVDADVEEAAHRQANQGHEDDELPGSHGSLRLAAPSPCAPKKTADWLRAASQASLLAPVEREESALDSYLTHHAQRFMRHAVE